MPYQGPYRVMYYVHDIFSNQEDYYRQRYCQIMLKEEAEMKELANLIKEKGYTPEQVKEILEKQ